MQSQGIQVKIIVGFVGLPARGKTYFARKIMKYISWLGYKSRVFNLGNYRRELKNIFKSYGTKVNSLFFNQNNEQGAACLHECAQHALKDMMEFLQSDGNVAIYDATNTTRKRRQEIIDFVNSYHLNTYFFWVESICDDESILMNLYKYQNHNPDFESVSESEIIQNITERCEQFIEGYENVSQAEGLPYIRVHNLANDVEVHGITGYLPAKILCFLMNINALKKPIYLLRHGESLYNLDERVGGDPDMTEKGHSFGKMLENFFNKELENQNISEIQILTSTLQRAVKTAEYIGLGIPVQQIKMLDEINVGICDGLTYNEIELLYPFESKERGLNKLQYRYPRGESYLDLINKLEPVIFEMERSKDPIIIVSHQAILRCLYAYLKALPITEIPYISISQHCVMKFVQEAYCCKEDKFVFNMTTNEVKKVVISKDEILYVRRFSEL